MMKKYAFYIVNNFKMDSNNAEKCVLYTVNSVEMFPK